MKRKRTKLIILFLVLFPIIDMFNSCCDCEVQKHEKYSHKTLIVKNLDNNGAEPIVSESTELNKNAYGIRLYVMLSCSYTKVVIGKELLNLYSKESTVENIYYKKSFTSLSFGIGLIYIIH